MNARSSTAFSKAAPLVLTISLFALWGLGQRLYDTLLPQFAQNFSLQGYQLALTQSLYSFAYFLAAIPAALYARRFGYKAAVLAGLGVFCLGAFLLYPATETHSFNYFLFAVAVMSCGWIVLEVAANPLVASLGSEETSVRRLNLAQALFTPGSLLGIYCGRWLLEANLAVPTAKLTHSIVHPYIVLGAILFVLAFLFDDTRFPAVASERTRGLRSLPSEFRALFRRPLFLFAVLAQFFAVLALAGTWSHGGSYFQAAFPAMAPSSLNDVFVWALAVFGVGRLVGTALMYRFRAECVLLVFSAGGLVLAAVSSVSGGALGAIAMLASSFFLSITWPTILGFAIRGLGPLMKIATALVCMGGAAGGFAFQFLSVIWTPQTAQAGMLLPVIAYAMIFGFALKCRRAWCDKSERSPATVPLV